MWIRWVAGLAAALLIPACGGGSGRPFAGNSTGGDSGGAPSGAGNGQLVTIRLVSPASGSSASAGSTVTLQAEVSDPNSVVARVEFYDDHQRIGSDEDPPYTLSYKHLKAGTHQLCAVAVEFDGRTVASAPVTLFVVQGSGDDHDDDEDDGHGHDHDRNR